MSDTLPLVVDLDGTLIHSDTLVENWLRVVRRRPWVVLLTPLWMVRGRAYLKNRLAEGGTLRAEGLPYHQEFLAWLRASKKQGRPVHLATAADRRVAEAVSAHLGLFDSVFASDASSNLKGGRKAARLVEEFGRGGFVYAGNHSSDLDVWAESAAAVLVSTPPSVARRVTQPIEAEFPRSGNRVLALLRAMRLYQWVKNLLVFLPLITANGLLRGSSLVSAGMTFLAFSLLASGVYLVNDLFDLEADRRHPRKRRRPFASGTAPVVWGILTGPLLMLLGVGGGFAIDFWVGATLVGYAVLTLAYSAYLKTQPLVDVFTLALLYTMRIVAGGIAVNELASIWLLSFSSFFFLSLGFLKRYVELAGLDPDREQVSRRGYGRSEDDKLFVMGVASSFAASIVLALYVDTSVAESIYTHPEAVWGFVPLSLFWQMRMWLAAERGFVDDDPIAYAARDWVSALVLIAAGCCYLAAVALPQ